MTWIQTYTGKRVDPFHLRQEDVCIEDIAHALSNICRFNGHCNTFYSVAQHSVMVADLVGPDLKLAALLHDAHEAYLGDVVTPIKSCTGYKLHGSLPRACAELDVQFVIDQVLGMGVYLSSHANAKIKHADRVMLATEARYLMGADPKEWGIDEAPLAETIIPVTPAMAKDDFLSAYRRYTNQNQESAP